MNKENNIITRLIDRIPSQPLSNYLFQNQGNLRFSNKAREWGLGEETFSNGSAYADLDNDGDLDLVLNNVNMPCSIYRNESSQQNKHHYLQVKLQTASTNKAAIGARVTLYAMGQLFYQEVNPMRGFESSVDTRLNFGLGEIDHIDSMELIWPDAQRSIVKDIKADQQLNLLEEDMKMSLLTSDRSEPSTVFTAAADNRGLNFIHLEDAYTDFDRDRLLFQMLSTQGPHIAKADVNGDGREDVFIGGARSQSAALYVQQTNGGFTERSEPFFVADAASEDVDAVFFDCDSDGDIDLYVCSGGNEFGTGSPALKDRLYLNDGKGNFTKADHAIPESLYAVSSCVATADFDRDGDLDLFVGSRIEPMHYGMPAASYLLANDGKGRFTDVTASWAPELLKLGMVCDADWADLDSDGKPDLVLAGEYLPISFFHNEGKTLKEKGAAAGFEKTNGWWNRLLITDLNGDGFEDLVAANHGLNSRFHASINEPVTLYVNDFDGNGSLDPVLASFNEGKSYPFSLRQDLVNVIPGLKKQFLRYSDYKGKTIDQVLSSGQLEASIQWHAYDMKTSAWVNDGKGHFSPIQLPVEVQFAPCYALASADYNGDGYADILLGGNFYESKPEAGIYDGSHGVLLLGNGRGQFNAISESASGIHIEGAM